MEKRLMFFLRFVSIGILLFATSFSSMSYKESYLEKIIGLWESKPTLSQLGKVIIFYSFRDDGTYSRTIKFLEVDRTPTEVVNGAYLLEEQSLITINQWGRSKHKIYFEDDELNLLQDERDLIKFNRK